MAFRKSFTKNEKKEGIRLTGLFADQNDPNRAAGTVKGPDIEALIELAQTCLANGHGMRIMAFFNDAEEGKPDVGLIAYESIPMGGGKAAKRPTAPKPRGPRMQPPASEEGGDE